MQFARVFLFVSDTVSCLANHSLAALTLSDGLVMSDLKYFETYACQAYYLAF